MLASYNIWNKDEPGRAQVDDVEIRVVDSVLSTHLSTRSKYVQG